MNPFVAHFVSSYLILPIMTVIFSIVACVIAKRNKFLNNKKIIFYILLGGIILALPGLTGFLDYNFMPYMYVVLVILYCILGYYNQAVLNRFFSSGQNPPSFGIRLLFTFTVMALGCGLFSLVFNLCNELQYGLWACTCLLPFIFPVIYRRTVECYFEIPVEIYKTWQYSDEYNSDTFYINMDRVMVVDLEIFRNVTDMSSERITGKVSEDSIFNQWFQRMIDDCNRKSPNTPIVYHGEDGKCYEWIFYIKPSFFKRRFYIDPDKTFAENNLSRRCVIIAKRVINENINSKEF